MSVELPRRQHGKQRTDRLSRRKNGRIEFVLTENAAVWIIPPRKIDRPRLPFSINQIAVSHHPFNNAGVTMRFATFFLTCLVLWSQTPPLRATEIGDYLRQAGWSAPATTTGSGLRVDTLAEDLTYSSRFRDDGLTDQPTMMAPTWSGHRPFLHWLPPLVVPAFRSFDPDDPYRHVGKGNPLEGTSWRNRPFHVGWLFGGIYGDNLVDQELQQTNDFFGGYRVGWDFDHYWGTELRLAWARLDVLDRESAMSLPAARNVFYDASLAYYPWGDAQWRPFASVGIGWADFSYVDVNNRLQHDQSFTMPLSLGVKYYWRKWMSLRAAVVDNIAFSSDRVDTMHSLSMTLGIEHRIGPPRRIYSSW